jgi:hypothetical protein
MRIVVVERIVQGIEIENGRQDGQDDKRNPEGDGPISREGFLLDGPWRRTRGFRGCAKFFASTFLAHELRAGYSRRIAASTKQPGQTSLADIGMLEISAAMPSRGAKARLQAIGSGQARAGYML